MPTNRRELAAWAVVALVLSGLSVPWFLWGDATVIAGLPLWIWWHVCWLVLAGAVFWYFTETAWGIGIEPSPRAVDGVAEEDTGTTPSDGGDRA